MRRHHAAVLSLCLSALGERSAADDAAQETFLKAYRGLGRFAGNSSFSTWLYRIASNHCLDLLRRKARERTESLDAIVEKEGEALKRLLSAGPGTGPAEEDSDLVRRVLDQLDPDYRLILTLREVSGLSYEELSEALDCTLDAVKARLQRARRRFEEILRHITGAPSV